VYYFSLLFSSYLSLLLFMIAALIIQIHAKEMKNKSKKSKSFGLVPVSMAKNRASKNWKSKLFLNGSCLLLKLFKIFIK